MRMHSINNVKSGSYVRYTAAILRCLLEKRNRMPVVSYSKNEAKNEENT